MLSLAEGCTSSQDKGRVLFALASMYSQQRARDPAKLRGYAERALEPPARGQ